MKSDIVAVFGSLFKYSKYNPAVIVAMIVCMNKFKNTNLMVKKFLLFPMKDVEFIEFNLR